MHSLSQTGCILIWIYSDADMGFQSFPYKYCEIGRSTVYCSLPAKLYVPSSWYFSALSEFMAASTRRISTYLATSLLWLILCFGVYIRLVCYACVLLPIDPPNIKPHFDCFSSVADFLMLIVQIEICTEAYLSSPRCEHHIISWG